MGIVYAEKEYCFSIFSVVAINQIYPLFCKDKKTICIGSK